MDELKSINSGYLTPEQRAAVKKDLYNTSFKSDLKVFTDHNGFVNGELHTFIGTKGSGKSTWSKTIIAELLYQDKNVLLYLSEERKDKYLFSLNESMFEFLKCEKRLKDMTEHILVMGEIDDKYKSEDEVLTMMKDIVEAAEIDIILIDNFTTSFMSELPINRQSEILRYFKMLADKLNIPVILFFHTSKLHDAKKLDGDNVRGSGTAINIGSYNYLIAQWKDGETLRNFVYTEKARYHSKANKQMYEVIYDDRVGLFSKCTEYYLEDYKMLVSGAKKPAKGFS